MQKSPLPSGEAGKSQTLKAVRSLREETSTDIPRPIRLNPTTSATPRVVINYIHGGLVYEEYNSKWKRQRQLSRLVTDVRIQADRVLTIHLRKSRADIVKVQLRSTTSLGDVVLLVQAGPMVLIVQFSIMEDLSHFNAIMGRTWLHDMKAIPFMYTKCSLLMMEEARTLTEIVNSTIGHGMLSFIDIFPGYHQIPMFQLDEENTSFVTPHWIYCYKVMPFGLKNAGATYQRLMKKIFKPLIDQTVDVYIDDIVVKRKTRSEHARHLEETFGLMKAYKMKLNPAKCAFGVSAGKFLGFMVTQRGIEVNPDQIKSVMEMSIPNWWTSDCETVFEKIKRYPTQPPILSSPQPGEQLYMYLAVFDCAVSVVLFRYVNDKEQSVARKLRPYFQAHQVIVLTNQPLRNILHKLDLFDRLGVSSPKRRWWILHVEGVSQASGSEIGLLLQSPTREQLEQAIGLGFPASNNEAEYEAILARLSLALTLSASKLEIRSDSHLVVRQIQEQYEAKNECMARYLSKLQTSLNKLSKWAIKRIHRSENTQADALAGIAVTLPVNEAVLLPTIIAYNGPQFDSIAFRTFCSELKIKNLYSTPRYPQSNEQAEATNKTLLSTLKKILEKSKGKWIDELPGVLWAYHTKLGRPTRTTLFVLAYGMNAVIPTEIGMPTTQTTVQGQRDEYMKLKRHLD
ncbi:Retrovirus-related Pol polyprotein from transposon 17.6 [Vitis vinifera]|uniref:Retrovirus-related Pol polyprotein from transposon 17.6 n=1 Tax=Vitis vinifera TaxID=29760 RepID=A0A438GBL7_VITVI|nr:Retrovirus-related Pol polyprotein from transposon 17.6 [Vitis vinifera]